MKTEWQWHKKGGDLGDGHEGECQTAIHLVLPLIKVIFIGKYVKSN